MSDVIASPTPDTLVAVSRLATTARLLSGALHEVNNALLVITGTVELLEGRTDLPEPVVRAIERLRRQGSRAAAALAEVTAFTQAPLDASADVDLRQVAQAAVDLRRFAVSRAGLTLQLDGAASCVVRGNGGYLQQAILNLIISAEHALRGQRAQIAVDVRVADGWGVVRVADDRPRGSVTEAAFEPFVAGRPPSDITGLSLFAARVIAARHGGAVTVDEDTAATALVLRIPR